MRLRRLKVLGVAMLLSRVAALIGVFFSLLPRNYAPSVNRIADFVILNDAKFWIDDRPALAKLVRFPERDDENESLRLIRIDEASMNAPDDPRSPGLGRFPWPRGLYGILLKR